MTDRPSPIGGPAPRRWPADPTQLVDTTRCPACFSSLSTTRCGVCGLDLDVPEAAELLQRSTAVYRGELARQELIERMREAQTVREAWVDLSTTSVVKKAQASRDPVGGAWVIGTKIIDLGITSILSDNEVISYLVVGETVDQTLLKPLGTATGVSIGIAIGTEWTAVSDEPMRAMTNLAQNPAAQGSLFELNGTRYVANVVELEQMGQSRPRLVLAQSLAPTGAAFSIFRWLLWLSPILVLIGMVLAISRSTYRAS